ncbi:DUF1156 domain-containing protein [Mesorhizobium sp. B2-8-3]|uniref:DUF1156 domain-containing protein n=1 Tax=Mesorhizobium sp. B2-8-3 TaxID=2589905 RepID=UPI00112D019D|nr:DUF1156 domain-containing protein [Mesorhizobium sp. B2-8-3]TPJ27152.1 DUF1156 domain-containing protein [Mesorhizobium sp. B2-8-3]
MTVAAPRKKLIEVSIPLEAINKASAREKSIRHGHPSTLHLWWARRPLAACRAVLFAQLVDDPSSWPDKFPTEAEQEVERLRLHRVIERMVPWEASNDEAILDEARWEIARSVAWGLGEEPPAKDNGSAILAYLQEKAAPVYDPFSGGGSIPLEAQRLGLRAYGSDLNPVAVLIGKALLEIPPRFAGRQPVNPKARSELKRGGSWNGKGAQGLADDVRYYGKWMRDEAEKQIGHLYPNTKLSDGSEARVIAWLWARTVRSPDPAAKGAMVPLYSSLMLSRMARNKAWASVTVDPTKPNGWAFQTHTGAIERNDEEELRKGNVQRSSGAKCTLTGTSIPFSYIRAEGINKRLGQTLMATIAEGPKGRIYLSPDTVQETSAHRAKSQSLVDTPLAGKSRVNLSLYGFETFGDIFSERQKLALEVFSSLVSKARQQIIHDATVERAFDSDKDREGYADAVATYLAFNVSSVANSSSQICTWDPGGPGWNTKVRNTFSRQALPMTWDYAEINPFSGNTGSFDVNLEYLVKAIQSLEVAGGLASVSLQDAAENNYKIKAPVFSTDPPYYDNIGYADLSDFFYVWLKISLQHIWPDLFRRLSTPKEAELVATPTRHGNRQLAEEFFMQGMSRTLGAMQKAAADGIPLTIYYAFKQSEVAEEGITSAGWASFLQGVVDSGLLIDGTWPIRTESAGRLIGNKANALASSIVLVCRKINPTLALGSDRAGFIAALRRELPAAITKIRAAGVGPVDMQQSVIGPGMGVFTRYLEVLEDDDSKMTVKTALSIINRTWEEIDNEIVASFDPETQVALAWFSSYGFEPKPSGELITLANAKDTTISDLFASEVFADLKGRTALTKRGELDPRWSPIRDRRLTVWECVQHLARTLSAAEGGAQAAARLIVEMGPKATDARALLDRLFQVATDKGWAQEALVYNQLAEEWPHLLERSTNIFNEVRPAETGDLFA